MAPRSTAAPDAPFDTMQGFGRFSPSLLRDLFAIEAKGLGPAGAAALRASGPLSEPLDLVSAGGPRRNRLLLAAARGLSTRSSRRKIVWPALESVAALAERLAQREIALVWREDEGYPRRLIDELGDEAPLWLFIRGAAGRLRRRQCAVIGSRLAPPRLCAAGFQLGRALASAGVTVTSGLAQGADQAAHDGAMTGRAGSVGVAPRGLMRQSSPGHPDGRARITLIGLGRPEAAFHAGLAIERNYVIAALSSGLVLVASGRKGGSAYALRWALRRGRPVWCFEDGRATPAGNASLIRAGAARPLSLADSPEAWAHEVKSALAVRSARRARRRGEPVQLDWLA